MKAPQKASPAPVVSDPRDLPGAARYAVRVAATVVTRFGGRPVASRPL